MYNFKKNAKLYIVDGTSKYAIDIYPDLSASQTFDEQSYKNKTLHRQLDLYDGATISKANPANFSFTMPLISLNNGFTNPIVFSLANDYSTGNLKSFDIYIESDNVVYKIERCVIESLTFNLSMKEVLTVSISGTGSKLSLYSSSASPLSIPGTLVTYTNKMYNAISRISLSIGEQAIDSVASIHIDIKNEVSWPSYNTLQASLSGTVSYPYLYTLSGRSLTGSATEFITSSNINTLYDSSTNAPLVLKVYSDSSAYPILNFNLPSTVFTRRLNIEDLINRVYDFRLNTNTETNTFTYGIEPSLSLNFIDGVYTYSNL